MEPGLEFDAKEVADLPVHAVDYAATQFAAWVPDAEASVHRYWNVHLNTGTGNRDVFEVRHGPARTPPFVLPTDIDEIGAQQTGFSPAIPHTQPTYRRASEKTLAAWADRLHLPLRGRVLLPYVVCGRRAAYD